jgi:acetyltransferase-like isoleucine patch superfamily enzyme
MTIEDDVFIGPNATFTNDKYPRSKQYPDSFQRLRLKQGCSIGAGAIVLGGISVGAYSIIGAGSVVTKDVPPHALVTGSPATLKGWLDEKGVKLIEKEPGQLEDGDGGRYIINDGQLVKL